MNPIRFTRNTAVAMRFSLHLILLASALLVSCGAKKTMPVTAASLEIVATTPVLEQFVKRLGTGVPGLHTSLAFQTHGQCLHEHQVSTNEMRALCSAKLIVANGVNFEPFLDQAMRQCPQVPVVRVGDSCADLPTHTGGADPHLWFGAKNVDCMVAHTALALATFDSAHAKIYGANDSLVRKQLASFWDSLRTQNANLRGVPVVSFHGAFGYLSRELGMNMVSSFGEELEDMTPSAQDIAQLIAKIRSEKVQMLFVAESENPSLAAAVARETGVKTVHLRNMMEGLDSTDLHAYENTIRDDVSRITKP